MRILQRLLLKNPLKDTFAVSVDLRDFLTVNFSFSSLNVKELKNPKTYFISCVLVNRQKNFLNGERSEDLVNHPVKGRPHERVTCNANQKKKIFFLDTSQGKSANSFTLSVKDEEGNLFDFNDMKIEFVLEFL